MQGEKLRQTEVIAPAEPEKGLPHEAGDGPGARDSLNAPMRRPRQIAKERPPDREKT